MLNSVISGLLLVLALALPAVAGSLVEPRLHIARGGTTPQVALTLDACMGDIDMRILDVLVAERIPATIFVTGIWLKRNPEALLILLAHPDLFEIENHGLEHIPAVTNDERPYGTLPAGSAEAVVREVRGGAEAIRLATGRVPHWYRDATALYSPDALDIIGGLGFRVAGYSLNADFGATASEKVAAAQVAAAQDGDVIIAHINQPRRAAGAGIAKGIAALKARGYRFVRLGDVAAAE